LLIVLPVSLTHANDIGTAHLSPQNNIEITPFSVERSHTRSAIERSRIRSNAERLRIHSRGDRSRNRDDAERSRTRPHGERSRTRSHDERSRTRTGVERSRTRAGSIISKGNLQPGSTLVFEIRDKGFNNPLESIRLKIDANNADQYIWPHALATAINAQSLTTRAGQRKGDTNIPIYSGYLNEVWVPNDLPLNFTYRIENSEYQQHKLILDRLTQNAMAKNNLANVKKWLGLEKNGSFSDITYPDNKKPLADNKVASQHLLRVLELASYAHENRKNCQSLTADCTFIKDVQSAAVRGMLFIIAKKYKYHNWWFSSIGDPRSVARVALLIYPDITPDQMINTVLPYLRVANVANGEYNFGANTVDYASIQQMWSTLALNGGVASDADLKKFDGYLRESTSSLAGLAVVLAGKDVKGCEGLRADMSFTSHCALVNGKLVSQIYTAGYGQVFMDGIISAQYSVQGTDYDVPQQNMDLLERWLVEGIGWSGYAGITDFHVTGRGHSRSSGSFNGLVNKFSTHFLAMNPNSPRKEMLLELLHRGKTGDESDNKHYRGNRYFWTTDNMAHFGSAYSSSLRMVSKRTTTSESGNGEGLQSYFLGAGSQLITRTGNDYRDIQPVWNWKRLPGTTAEQDTLALPLNNWGRTAYGSHHFVGGLTDGIRGLATMELDRLNIKGARKSYFHFEDANMNMGSNINSQNSKAEVITSVEQALRQGSIMYRLKNSTVEHYLNEGQTLTSGEIVWVQHNGIEYIFPHTQSQSITVQSKAQSGSWRNLNTAGSANTMTKEVFSLWLKHGKGTAGRYLYYVHPASNFHDIGTYGESDKRVDELKVRRESWLHAVLDTRHNLGMAAVFEVKDEWIKLTSDLEVKTPMPLLLLAKLKVSRDTAITVSDPTQDPAHKNVLLKLKGRFYCWQNCEVKSVSNDKTEILINLPQGLELGKSVTAGVHR